MLEYRIIKENELDDAIKLSEYSFKYVLKGEEREKRAEFMNDHTIIGVFDENKMIAKTHVIPLSLMIKREIYDMGGIYGVATYPEYRRKGIVNELMDMSLKLMNEKGDLVSYLHPFDIGFYRKYGWELISNLKKTTVEAIDFSYDKTVEGRVIRPKGFERLPDMNEIYLEYIKKYNGMMARPEKWWMENKYEDNYSPAIYYDENNIPKGYMFYKINEDVMEISEYIYLDEKSRKGLFNFISNHDSMVKRAEIITTDDEPMYFLFDNPVVKTEILPYFMGRIVNLERFLKKYLKDSKSTQKITLWIVDESAPWNQGKYEINREEIQFSKYSEIPFKEIDFEKELLIDIGTITALLLGFQRVGFLREAGKLKGEKERIEEFESLIDHKYSSFLDYF